MCDSISETAQRNPPCCTRTMPVSHSTGREGRHLSRPRGFPQRRIRPELPHGDRQPILQGFPEEGKEILRRALHLFRGKCPLRQPRQTIDL